MNVLSYLPKSRSKSKRTQRFAKPPAAKVAPRPVMNQPAIPLPGDLKRKLNALRSHHRSVGISTGLAMTVGVISFLFLVQGVTDWWFDLPWFARAGFLLADIVILVSIYRRQLVGPLRKKLTLAETALLVEKKWPKLKQSIISAVELADGRANATRGSQQLLSILLQQAHAASLGLKFNEVVSTRGLRRWIILASVSVLGTAAITAATWPASIALIERIFLLNVPLPTKTIVVPITRDLIVPVGSDVEISASAQGIIPTRGRVTLTYANSAPQEFPLTVLPDKPATFSLTVHNVQSAFKYSFYLNDGHGPEFSVTAKVPPAATDLACQQIYPDYTSLPPRKLAPTDLSLLAGSHLKIQATSTDPLKKATIVLQGVTQTINATIDGSHIEADVPIPAKDVTGFSIHLVDQSGVSSANETVYPIVLLPDNPPVIKILQPKDDHETITLRAKPVIVFEATDDFGLNKLTLNYQLVAPPVAGEETTAPSDVQTLPITVKPAKDGRHYEYVLDVATQTPAWKEGYTVNYWIEATDNNTVTGPGITKTDHKQFGIVSLETKQAEILDRLKENASEIDHLSDTQQKINNDVGEAIPQK